MTIVSRLGVSSAALAGKFAGKFAGNVVRGSFVSEATASAGARALTESAARALRPAVSTGVAVPATLPPDDVWTSGSGATGVGGLERGRSANAAIAITAAARPRPIVPMRRRDGSAG